MAANLWNARAVIGPVLLGLAMVSAAPAMADPRDEALAGASRCRTIADDRMFLDCVYGAMQPLRAKLGLPPAPAAQLRLVPPANAAVAPAPPPVARAPRGNGLLGDIFGSGQVEVAPQRLAAYSFDRNGLFTVTLADGEVWRQVEGDTALAHWHEPPSSLVAAVYAGSLGAHILRLQGQSAGFKVTRIR